MRYYKFLEANKKQLTEQLKVLMTKYKVQPVGTGFIDCIVMKSNLEEFIQKINELGILVYVVTWWCYVNPNEKNETGCPHGMGGPYSEYYDGWFSELQNHAYKLENKTIKRVMRRYDKELIIDLNMKTFNEIKELLKKPFKYTPTEYIEGNKCVIPALWFFIPDSWRKQRQNAAWTMPM